MRAYPEYELRTVTSLDGVWDLAFLGEDIDLNGLDVAGIEFSDAMIVPAAVDASPAYAGRRGTFVYRTVMSVTPEKAARLKFHGLGLWCRVIVDGEVLEENSLPYTGFSAGVPASHMADRELIVVIDNRFDRKRVPLQEQYYDFYAYGGIYRSVELHEVEACSIDRVRVTGKAGELEASIYLHGDIPATVNVSIRMDGGEAREFTGLKVNDGIAVAELGLPDISLWSPEEPNLHTIQIIMGEDDIIERFGVRALSIKDGNVLINGKAQKLLGYNRHEVHPQFGPALPAAQLLHDLQILKDLGCNFVRGAHYPQDQRFLDLCDELGFLVMEESLSWQAKIEHFNDPAFCDAQAEQTRRMVRNSINHPSVFLWGFFNEGNSHEKESCHIYTRLAETIRTEDDSRFVSFACNHPDNELNFDICDIICINMYPGWYTGSQEVAPHSEILPGIKRVMEQLKEHGQQDKPFIITEIGAGAIYGWRDPHAGHWSEQYQAQYLETVCNEVVSNDKIAGVALWQFCDGRTYSNGFSLGRPRTFNNKGTLDEYRRPKQAYEAVKRIFTAYNSNE